MAPTQRASHSLHLHGLLLISLQSLRKNAIVAKFSDADYGRLSKSKNDVGIQRDLNDTVYVQHQKYLNRQRRQQTPISILHFPIVSESVQSHPKKQFSRQWAERVTYVTPKSYDLPQQQ